MDITNRFMSSEALQPFRRGITPGKNDSFDALSNQLVSACAEICQKHKVNLNYGDFSASFLSIVKEYMRGDLYEDKGAIINQLRTSGTMIQKVIIEQLDKHINSADKLKIVKKHDGTYSDILRLKTTAFNLILSFIDSPAFKNKVQEVSQQSNLFQQEAPREIKPEIKRDLTRSEVEGGENDRYNSNPLQLVQKHEIPKEITESTREITQKKISEYLEQIISANEADRLNCIRNFEKIIDSCDLESIKFLGDAFSGYFDITGFSSEFLINILIKYKAINKSEEHKNFIFKVFMEMSSEAEKIDFLNKVDQEDILIVVEFYSRGNNSRVLSLNIIRYIAEKLKHLTPKNFQLIIECLNSESPWEFSLQQKEHKNMLKSFLETRERLEHTRYK